MKLVYFLSQYDLLDPVTKVSRPVSESLNDGHSVTVCMEGSSAHRLQTTTLVSTGKGCVHIHQYQLLGVWMRMSRGPNLNKQYWICRMETHWASFISFKRIFLLDFDPDYQRSGRLTYGLSAIYCILNPIFVIWSHLNLKKFGFGLDLKFSSWFKFEPNSISKSYLDLGSKLDIYFWIQSGFGFKNFLDSNLDLKFNVIFGFDPERFGLESKKCGFAHLWGWANIFMSRKHLCFIYKNTYIHSNINILGLQFIVLQQKKTQEEFCQFKKQPFQLFNLFSGERLT